VKTFIRERPDLSIYYTYHDQYQQPQWFATPDLLARFK